MNSITAFSFVLIMVSPWGKRILELFIEKPGSTPQIICNSPKNVIQIKPELWD
jgi:hypothetical protein